MRQPLFWRLAFAGLAVFLCVLLTGHFWLPRDDETGLPDGQAQGHLPRKAGQLVQLEEAAEWPPCRGPVGNETVPEFASGAQTHWYSYRPVDEKEVTLVTWLPHDRCAALRPAAPRPHPRRPDFPRRHPAGCSASRLDLLRQQCEAWPHTISATVFVVKTYLDQLVCMAPREQARGGSANATSPAPAPAPAPGAAACAYKGMSLGALRKNLTDWNVEMMEAGAREGSQPAGPRHSSTAAASRTRPALPTTLCRAPQRAPAELNGPTSRREVQPTAAAASHFDWPLARGQDESFQ
jgi:hypothetical protein